MGWVRSRVVVWTSVAAVSALLLVAPGSSDAAMAQPVPNRSPGCGHSVSIGSTTLNPTIDGLTRTVIVHVPTKYAKSDPIALVLNLHGSGSTAAGQEIFSGMDETADDNTFIVAYPQGVIPLLAGFDWNVPGVPLVGGSPVPKGAADDVEFLTKLVTVLDSKYCIDEREVYATGMSGGGRMASQLACDASQVFAAVAPVAGLRRPTPCPTTRPVPVIAFHGTADEIDPFNGNGQKYWTYSVTTALLDWAGQDKCASTPSVSTSKGYTRTSYSECAGGVDVELYAVKGEGHEWPGGPTMPRTITEALGPQSNAVSANALMWAFFVAHPQS